MFTIIFLMGTGQYPAFNSKVIGLKEIYKQLNSDNVLASLPRVQSNSGVVSGHLWDRGFNSPNRKWWF